MTAILYILFKPPYLAKQIVYALEKSDEHINLLGNSLKCFHVSATSRPPSKLSEIQPLVVLRRKKVL